MHWIGTCWQPEDTLKAFDRSRTLCRAAGDADAKTVAAVVTLARSDRRIAATAEQWDADPMRLQTTRTTIDLRNGFEYPPERSHYITKQTGTYLAPPSTPHPLWTGFLDLITEADQTLIGFLQRLSGYCLTGLVREQVLAFLYGLGGNGKGVFVNTLAKIMGDYAITAPIEMFLASKHERHPTEIARLKGARLVIAQETQKGRRWDETKLKALTGGDRLSQLSRAPPCSPTRSQFRRQCDSDLAFIELGFLRGTRGTNAYGPDPSTSDHSAPVSGAGPRVRSKSENHDRRSRY